MDPGLATSPRSIAASFFILLYISKPKTFNDVFNALMESKRNRGVSESTIKENERYFNFINPKIRNKLITRVSEDELRKWLIEEYLPRKPKKEALKKVIQMIKAVYSFAIRKKLCINNPAQDIMLEDYVKFCELRTKANEDKAFSEEEIEKLRNYCL